MLKLNRYLELVEWCHGRELHVLWHYLEDDNSDFNERKQIFLYVLEKLLKDKYIRLERFWSKAVTLENRLKVKECGIYLIDAETLTIEQQVAMFREQFPKDERELNDDAPCGAWFFDGRQTASVVWLSKSVGHQ